MTTKYVLSIAVLAMVVLSTALLARSIASSELPTGKPRIDVDSAGLRVDFAPMPIGKLLQLVAEKTGARVFFYGERQEQISGQFFDPSVADGVRRLLRGRDLIFVYQEATDGTAGRRGTPRLAELHVFDDSGSRASQLTLFTPNREASGDSTASQRGASGRTVVSHALTGLVKQLLESTDSQLRKDAAAALAKSGDAAALDALSQALAKDNEPSVRQAVAEALGKSWNDAAVVPLAQSLNDDRSAAVREAAAAALGTTWSESAVNPLLQALANDRDALVREQAARALGNTAGEAAVAALAQTLAQDPRWSVREAAAIALGSIGGSDARDALVRAAETDSDPWVKEAGLMSILDMAK